MDKQGYSDYFMRSGKTLNILLLLAFLVTLFAIAFFVKAKTDFPGSRPVSLKKEAAAFQATLDARLGLASHALELIAMNPDAASVETVASSYFTSVNFVDPDGRVLPLLGDSMLLPDQSEAVRIHAAKNRAALIVAPGASGQGRIVLLRLTPDNNPMPGVVTAEVSPRFLWGLPVSVTGNLYVINRQGRVLFSSSGQPPGDALKARLQPVLHRISGDVEWGVPGKGGKAGYQTFALRDNYAADDWTVVATSANLPVWRQADTLDWILVSCAALALLLAWILILKQRAGIRSKFTRADGSEIIMLQPADIVSAMDDFDRAILSNASFENVMDLVFKHIPRVVPCSLLAVTHFDEGDAQNTLVSSGDVTQTLELPKLDKELRQRLDNDPSGLKVDIPEEHTYLQPLASMGASRFELFPVYRDGELSAILHFGLNGSHWLNDAEHHYARAFADRLGVTLTSVVRGKKLYLQQHFDSVTGLPNRAFCRERLSQEISRARRKQLLVGVVYINLAGFKKVNDSLGYQGGDSILSQVAQRLKHTLRESDVVSRFGSDEFVVVLPDINTANEISKVAGKLVESFAPSFTYDNHATHLNAAMGVSLYPNDGQSLDQLLHNAEMAMTRIRSSGHTQYVYYEEHMNSQAIERLKLEHDLRQAVNDDGQIFLVYQPQIDLRTGKIAGVEALVRWNHPSRGLVNPGEFINLAEETGLIIKMSDIIRNIACRQYVEWHAKGLAPPRIAINVSSQDLRRKTFSDEVIETLKKYEVPTSAIELEITESMFVDASGGIVDVLRSLQSDGFLIAIDDFGTGYSSLSYLGLLPFDILKVDRSFVLGIGKPAEKIVSVIVDVAHTFEKKVIAEGVDSEHQHAYLVELGCEIIQGYLFSKPLKAEEFEKYALKMAA